MQVLDETPSSWISLRASFYLGIDKKYLSRARCLQQYKCKDKGEIKMAITAAASRLGTEAYSEAATS
jgi:hypothetical protein